MFLIVHGFVLVLLLLLVVSSDRNIIEPVVVLAAATATSEATAPTEETCSVSTNDHEDSTGKISTQSEVSSSSEEVEEENVSFVCSDCGVEQNVGRNDERVPTQLTKQMEAEVHAMNKYHASLLMESQSDDKDNSHEDRYKYLLVRQRCQNQHELCIFWKVQDRCDSPDFKSYLFSNCPLACRFCHNDEYRSREFLRMLWEELPQQYYGDDDGNDHLRQRSDSTTDQDDDHDQYDGSNKIVHSRMNTLRYLLSRLDMDPSLMTRSLNVKDDSNWIEVLHARLMAVIPDPLLRLYSTTTTMTTKTPPSSAHGSQYHDSNDDNDLDFLMSLFGSSSSSLVPYRNRGYVLEAMLDFDHYVTRPIQLSIGFAIPSSMVASEIVSIAHSANKRKVLYIGAGTGYFGSFLQQQQHDDDDDESDIEVIAYDLHPPAQHHNNAFFDVDFSNNTVRSGTCMDVVSNHPSLVRDSIVLIVWPNDPDPIDNPHFTVGEDDNVDGVPSQATWDAECLQAVIDTGGEVVVYVGEREDNLSSIPRSQSEMATSTDSGISSTRAFQTLLKRNFELIKTIPIPQWWLNEDDVTIWRRFPDRAGAQS